MKRSRSLAPLDGTVSRSLPLSRVAPTGSYQVRPQLSNFGASAASGGFPVPLVTTSAQEFPLLQAPRRFWTTTNSKRTLSGLYGRPSTPTPRALPSHRKGAMSKIWPEELREGATFTLSKSGRSRVWRRPCGRVASRMRTRTSASCG